MRNLNRKKMLTGVLAVSMATSSMSVFPIAGLAAEDEAAIKQMVMRVASDEPEVKTHTEHPELLTEQPEKDFVEAIDRLYGIETNELSEEVMGKFAIAMYLDNDSITELNNTIADIKAAYAALSDTSILHIAINCPVRIAAYASIDNNLEATIAASDVVKKIAQIDDEITVDNYALNANALFAARKAYNDLTNETAKSYLDTVLVNDGSKFDGMIMVGTAGVLPPLEVAYDNARLAQQTTFETAVNAIVETYSAENFIELGNQLNACKTAWNNIVSTWENIELTEGSTYVSLLTEELTSDAYTAYDGLLTNEKQYFNDIVAQAETLYNTIKDNNNDLDKLEIRNTALGALAEIKDRFDDSTVYDAADYKLSDNVTTLSDVFGELSDMLSVYNADINAKEYLDTAKLMIDKYPSAAEYNFTQDEISNDYNTVVDLIGEATETINDNPELNTDNVTKINSAASDLNTIKSRMEDCSVAMVNDIITDINTLGATVDKFTKTYIDSLNDQNDIVNGVNAAVRSIAATEYGTAQTNISALFTELAGVIDTNYNNVINTYQNVIGDLDGIGLTYKYGYSDTVTDTQIETAITNGRSTVAAMDGALEILGYYSEKAEELDLTKHDDAVAAIDSFEEHYNAIKDLRAAAEAVNVAFAACPIDINDAATEDFDELYNFIEEEFEGSNDSFNTAYGNFRLAMESYIGLVDTYDETYADEEFVNEVLSTKFYVEPGIYERWSATNNYINEYMSENGYYAEAVNDAEDFLADLTTYKGSLYALDANEQYADNYEEMNSLYADFYDEGKLSDRYEELIMSSSKFFIPTETGTDIANIKTALSNWKTAEMFTSKIKPGLDLLDDVVVNENYASADPEMIIPKVDNDDEDALDDYMYALRTDYNSRVENALPEVSYIAANAVEDINNAIIAIEAKNDRLVELVADRDFVLAWEDDVDTLGAMSFASTSSVSEETSKFIDKVLKTKADIDEDEDKTSYANRNIFDMASRSDILAAKPAEYARTSKAKEFDDALVTLVAETDEDAQRAGFKEIDDWFTAEENNKYFDDYEILTISEDVMLKMSKYSIYTELKNKFDSAEVNNFADAVTAIGAVMYNSDLDGVKTAIDTADGLYDVLTEQQKTYKMVVAQKAVLETARSEYDRWTAVAADNAELIAKVAAYCEDVAGFADNDDLSDAYTKLIARYNELATEFEALDEESDGYTYMYGNGYKVSLDTAYNELITKYAYVGVSNDIEAAYEAASGNCQFATVAEKLVKAEKSYAALNSDMKMMISNYGKLTYARARYNRLGYGQDKTISELDLAEEIRGLSTPSFTNYKDVKAQADTIKFYIDSLSEENREALENELADDAGKLQSVLDICAQYENRGGKPGDVNDDGHVYINDVVIMLEHLMSGTEFDDLGMSFRADVTWDGVFDDYDVLEAIKLIEF